MRQKFGEGWSSLTQERQSRTESRKVSLESFRQDWGRSPAYRTFGSYLSSVFSFSTQLTVKRNMNRKADFRVGLSTQNYHRGQNLSSVYLVSRPPRFTRFTAFCYTAKTESCRIKQGITGMLLSRRVDWVRWWPHRAFGSHMGSVQNFWIQLIEPIELTVFSRIEPTGNTIVIVF